MQDANPKANTAASGAPVPRGRKKKIADVAAPEVTQEVTTPTQEVDSTVSDPTTDSQVAQSSRDDAAKAKKFMDTQPKIAFYVPLLTGEKEGAVETVTVNDHKYTIKKGEMVELPKPIAEILSHHLKVNMGALGSGNLATRGETKEGISVADALS